jgi:hypothetical protein
LNCTHIECEIKQLAEDEFVLVEVFGRLWLNTLIDDGIFEAHISSLGLAKISALPNYSPPAWMTAVCLLSSTSALPDSGNNRCEPD